VHSLAKDWLTECMSFHGDCASKNQGRLPTRVLQIVGGSRTPLVRLIETEGVSGGRYCALSHCWGPANKQPLRTTHENYQSHLGGISLGRLPKSFRDAIMLTQGLNIEYLWIDSLCIIQDNEQDWRYEAGRMARVYRNAALVIAASDAKDSTEGLFITERKCESTITVPHIVRGIIKGSFNIAQLPVGKSWPSGSHLDTRAWAFQERLLARRIIFFTRAGVSWQCSNLETWEHGAQHHLYFYESKSWFSLLGCYCEKQITNAEDRLYALRGIAEEMQNTREDQYNPVYGIWDTKIYEQLLWKRSKPPPEAGVLDLPTWTWAATGGAKTWCVQFEGNDVLQAMPKLLDLSSSGALVSSGHCTRRPLSLRYLIRGDWIYSWPMVGSSDAFHEKYMLPGEWGGENYPSYVIKASSGATRILGISVFDREPATSAKCFFIAKNGRYTARNSDEVSSHSASNEQHAKGIDCDCTEDKEKRQTEPLGHSDKQNPRCTTGAGSSSDETNESFDTFVSTFDEENVDMSVDIALRSMFSDGVSMIEPEDVAIVSRMSSVYTQQFESNSPRQKISYIYQKQHRSSTGVFYSNQRAKASTSASVSPCSTPTRSKPLGPSLQNSKSSRLISKIIKRYQTTQYTIYSGCDAKPLTCHSLYIVC
jgi:hypothetical protein